MQIQATLIDYQKIDRLISGLNDIDKDKVIKQGLRDATAVFLRAGRNNLKERMKNKYHTGNLMKSFKNKVKRMKLGSIAGFDGLGMHAHLVDQGTDERFTKGKGKKRRKPHSTGKAIGNNFWTDAINSNKTIALDKVYTGIERAVNKILQRN